MNSLYGSQNNYFFQFFEWSARLVRFEEDSINKNQEWAAAAGELCLLPRAERREVVHKKKILNLDVFFRVHRKNEIEMFRKLQPGAWLVVSGELTERQWLKPYPDLKTTCYIKEASFDPSEGTLSPTRAHLYNGFGNNMLG